MGIALFSFNSLLAPLQGLVGWFVGASPARCPATLRAAPATSALNSIAPCHRPTRGLAIKPLQKGRSRPLRVLRVVDGSQPRANAGRMVISGRMADVCAELDRLAALEAAAS